MAHTTQSVSDAARIKRGALSVKTKRKQPFVLSLSSTQTREGLKRNIKRMK